METDIAYNVELKNNIETYVTKKIAEILNTNPFDLDKDENLLELGFESSSLVKFSEDFESEINIKLFPTVFFEHQTISEVSVYFSTEFTVEFEKYLNKTTLNPSGYDEVRTHSNIQTNGSYESINEIQEERSQTSEKANQEKIYTNKFLWVNIGKENIIKTHELTNNFNAYVTTLLSNNNLFELSENSIVVFYADQLTLENVKPQIIFSMLRFLRDQIITKPKEVIFLLEDLPDSTYSTDLLKLKEDFYLIPHENISDLPFRVESLNNFNNQSLNKILNHTSENITFINKEINENDIAIIGMDCKFPKSDNIEAYWDNIINQRDLIEEVDDYRSNIWKSLTSIQNEDLIRSYKFWGGFIDGVDKFDHEFFKISAREAEVMDPQQRLFLQSVWNCIEHAGYDPKSLSNSSTGVFGAVGTRDYHELSLMYQVSIEPQLSTGLAHSILSNRVSYLLNLNGPSESIDTACSSSLVALHRAVKAIHNKECSQAIVGGVNLNLSPLVFMAFYKTGILSPEGRCRSFDKAANGYARGEGVGTVFIKSLSKAISDGDYIHGVIKGTAVNHGGYGQSLTAPNPVRQSEVIAKAIEVSGCDPSTIGYIEAHGTGTALGDTVEIEGLKRAFKKFNKKQDIINEAWCSVGSVKSNIGHLETAAGIAGLLKVMQSFKYKKIPASIHIDVVNPLFSLKNSPFTIAQKPIEWKRINPQIPLRAGLSSFGFGGTNAHVVLEEYINKQTSSSKIYKYFFPFSAPSISQLDAYLKLFVSQPSYSSFELENIAFTLQNGRTVYNERCAFEAETFEQLIDKIRFFINSKSHVELDNISINQWVNKESNSLKNENLIAQRVPLCSFPFNESSHWLQFGENFEAKENLKHKPHIVSENIKPINFEINNISAQSVEDLLIHQISVILKRSPDSIDRDVSLLDYGLDSILGMSLVKQLEQVFEAPIYINELLMHDTIRKLTNYLESEFGGNNTIISAIDKSNSLKTNVDIFKGDAPVVFVLSTPRSGSTLLRSMLMSNTKLFAPPELHLLNFNSLLDRKKQLGLTPLYEGLLETITSLMDIGVDEAKQYLKNEEENNTSSIEFYKKLQSLAGDRILVDKSPSYAENTETLFKAEAAFENAKYIVLMRHPFAVMESVIRNRFHRLIQVGDTKSSPTDIAENIWLNFNDNIRKFIKEISPEKYHLVFYEDLVNDPHTIIQKICDFLNIKFEEGMLNPYKEDNLIKGLNENSLSVGDPNFLKHSRLESDLAFSWMKDINKFPTLSAAGKKLSALVGYDIAEPLPITAIQNEYLKHSENVSWGLAHHFVFTCDIEINENILKEAVNDLLRAFSYLHRRLNSNMTFWEWEYDTNALSNVEYISMTPENYFEYVIDKYGSDINIQSGKNCILSVTKSSEKYEAVFLYSHLLGDGITSMQLISFLTDRLNGKSGYRLPMINSSLPAGLFDERIVEHAFLTNSTKSLYSFGNRKEIKFTNTIEETRGNYKSIFSILVGSLIHTLRNSINTDIEEIAIRYHNRNNDRLTISENFQEVGLYALDIPIKIGKHENFAEAFQHFINTGPGNSKSILLGGKCRFNFQPMFNNKNNYILIDSTETWSTKLPPKYELDCIARIFESNLDLIIRYNDSIYSDDFIDKIGSDWIQQFLNFKNKQD